ncbi:MAG: beta-ketoacyl synthase N-terminal-like domain-containing protein, partial [Chloroflexota bacterium]|nr:beta-ketoacyl synthase N-terminal-like domain-containing protein [Chloroflexota bacterium]
MTTRIVVTGIGVVSPVGLSRDSTWKNLLAGVSGIDHIAAFNPDDLETTIAGEVKGFEATDHMPRKDSRRMDRFSQLAVAAAGGAVEEAQFTGLNGIG